MDRKRLSFLIVLGLVLFVIPARSIKAQASACKLDNAAWVGSFGYSISCLDDSGWNAYLPGDTKLQSDQIDGIALCADGSTWIANTLGLFKVTASDVQAIDTDFTSTSAIACDSKGGVWVTHFQGISYYADGKWDNYDSAKLGTGDSASLVKDVVVGPDDKVYAVTTNSVATFDGSAWTIYEKGKGFDDNYFLEKIVLDSKGNPYIAEDGGILTFDGKKAWKENKDDKLSLPRAIAIDSKGVVWVGTYSHGLSSYDGKAWTNYDRTNSKISSNQVRALSIDSQDRIWLGTQYGLDVFDGKDFTVFRMDNSSVLDNEIDALKVRGKGPALPQPLTKKPGTLSGTILAGKDAVSATTVEVCVEFIGSSFSGDTPCGDNPFTQQAQTGSDGKFTFKDLPVGRYGLVVKGTDGKWQRLTDDSGINSKIEVTEGRDTDIGTVDLSKSSS